MQFKYFDFAVYGGISTQRNGEAAFQLAPDEALIIETNMPEKCRYWSIHTMDDHAFLIDWMNRQSNLNGFNAKIDADGVFRAVVSAQDPGVPNWIDNAGYKTGSIQSRWERCTRYPDHTVVKVKVAEVRNYLPAETPVVSAEERDAAIRLRRKGAQMRRRW